MLAQQLKEHMVTGLFTVFAHKQSQNVVFQPSENLHFENFSPGPTMVGPQWTLDRKEYLKQFL